MSVTVQGRVPRKWDDQAADHITRRFQILERALAGGATAFLSPATPAFGAGSITGGAGSGSGGSGGGGGGTTVAAPVTLAGLTPHAHQPDDVVGMEQRFYGRGESAPALPHVHAPEEMAAPLPALPHTHTPESLDLDSRFYRRGETVPASPHSHAVLSPDDEQVVLAARLFGG